MSDCHLEQERGIPTCWWADAVQRGFTQSELDDIDMDLTVDPGPLTDHRADVTCRECLDWIHA